MADPDAAGDVCAVGMAGFDSSEQHWARQRLAILDEAAVTIGSSLDLDRTARELAELVVPRFADFAGVGLLDAVMQGDEPPYAGLDGSVRLRRLAHMPLEHGAPEAIISNQDDFALARELAGRTALCIDNARRYTRERITALALQKSHLPSGPTQQSAPWTSRAGIGGDWFDIIRLSGARVGLVVGDVVGHGIQASAAMGRLRTAVQTLADVDLPPDELLAHLDDLVLRLGGDAETGDRPDAGETGATCLYAVYDPVSCKLAVASAGHPPPVLLLPDGTTRSVDISAGPVLGVGGLPFETTELELPEGTLIALYTDGLVEASDRDPDIGTTLLPQHPCDDVALVLARTKALDAAHVQAWDLTAAFTVVAEARRLATAQLKAWGLEEAGFVTELVVSELVTNAIRYGADPIQLRLIHDRTLICEVSDGNSTSPHLRRARIYDEGGRGLLLVAQLTTSWGTRHTATGKTIWAEQTLPPAAGV